MVTIPSFSLLIFLQIFDSILGFQGPNTLLTNYLIESHDKNTPPEGKIEVDYDIELVKILDVEELKQRMSVFVYIVEKWTDETLSWDSKNFSNIDRTWLPIDSIWIPDILVYNMLDHVNVLKDIRTPVEISSNGRVIHSYPAIYSITCEISISDFPFDDQQCALEIASWGYALDKLSLNMTTPKTLDHYSSNEEWALVKVGVEQTQYTHEGTIVSEARYIIRIRRKPLHYVVSLVVPSYIIAVLSVAGLYARFSTKPERQERFTLGVTSILTMAVLSLIVSEKVPHSAKHVPFLVQYFLYNIVVITLATVLTWPILSIGRRGFLMEAKFPPKWLLYVFHVKVEKFKIAIEDDLPVEFNRKFIAEAWEKLASRFDMLCMAIFLLLVSVPTLKIFFECAQLIQVHDVGMFPGNNL